MESTKLKVLWMITERGDRSFWTRIGVGNVNRDGSINLTIDAMPMRGAQIQLRDYTPRDAETDTTTTGETTAARTENGGGRGLESRAEPRP